MAHSRYARITWGGTTRWVDLLAGSATSAVVASDQGDGTLLFTGSGARDNGDGTFTLTGPNVVDNGDGTFSVVS